MPGYRVKTLLDGVTDAFTTPADGWHFAPGRLVLGWTRERIELNVKGKFATRVEGKSSLARLGLGIHVTAPTIHAGFVGTIQLELSMTIRCASNCDRDGHRPTDLRNDESEAREGVQRTVLRTACELGRRSRRPLAHRAGSRCCRLPHFGQARKLASPFGREDERRQADVCRRCLEAQHMLGELALTRDMLNTSIISDLIKSPQGRAAKRIAKVGGDNICSSIIVAELGKARALFRSLPEELTFVRSCGSAASRGRPLSPPCGSRNVATRAGRARRPQRRGRAHGERGHFRSHDGRGRSYRSSAVYWPAWRSRGGVAVGSSGAAARHAGGGVSKNDAARCAPAYHRRVPPRSCRSGLRRGP